MNSNILIRRLFFSGTGSKSKLVVPVPLNVFIEIVKNSIKEINVNAHNDFFAHKYDDYVRLFNDINYVKQLTISKLGFYSKTRFNIQYYTTRGWSQDEATLKISNNAITYTESKFIEKYGENGSEIFKSVKNKRINTFNNNFKSNKHKKFYRPSQVEYWVNKGFSHENALIKMNEFYSALSKKSIEKRRSEGKFKMVSCRQKEYWISRGFTLEEAAEKIKLIQDTRSLKSAICRYGVEEGTRKFNETLSKWIKTMSSKTTEEKLLILQKKLKSSKRYSKKSIYLFENVLQELKSEGIEFNKVYYGENEYYLYDHDNRTVRFYDLVIKDINLVVEYNGIQFHPKPSMTATQWKHWVNPITKKGADFHYQLDLRKKELATNKGFIYIVLWEDETFENLKSIIKNKILQLYGHTTN